MLHFDNNENPSVKAEEKEIYSAKNVDDTSSQTRTTVTTSHCVTKGIVQPLFNSKLS